MSSINHCFIDSRGTYIFRLVVPKGIRYALGVTEIRRSLQTHLPHVAKKRVNELFASCQQLFDELSNSDMSKKSKTSKFIPFKIPPTQMVFRLEKFNAGKIEMEIDSSPEKVKDEVDAAVSMLKQLGVEKNVEEFVESLQISDTQQPVFQNVSDVAHDLPLPVPPSAIATITRPASADDFTLREAVDLYLNSRVGKLKDRTYSSMVADLNHILPLIGGERRVSSLTVKDAQKFLEDLKCLPLYWSTRKPYAGLQITKVVDKVRQQIIDKKQVDLLSAKRINALSTLMCSWSKWAVNNTALSSHIFAGLKINQRESKALNKSRGKTTMLSAHQPDELIKIFNPETFGRWRNAVPYKYWCPLIAAFQGMRIEEVCDLSPHDFCFESEIWHFKIRDGETEWNEKDLTQDQLDTLQSQKSVKTSAGTRCLPIHSKLIELGLIEYMELRKKAGELWLFDLTEISHRRSHYPCKWFSEYRKSVDAFVKGQNFHSFRRCVASKFRAHGVPETHMKGVLGHQDESLGYKEKGGYSDPLPLQLLKDIIELITYPEIDGLPMFDKYQEMAKESDKQYRRIR